ncbi:MAG: hypothetical protein KGJ85_11245, partial [Betaproteobacteria bacterium]|nr:hypothetical protein [Betaproteobacteria bacterium]
GSYRVTVGTQPSGETCSVNNGVGYGMDANVTQVLVLCSSTGTYRVTGSVFAGQHVRDGGRPYGNRH